MPDWEITRWDFGCGLSFDDESSLVQGMVFSLDVKRDTSYLQVQGHSAPGTDCDDVLAGVLD